MSRRKRKCLAGAALAALALAVSAGGGTPPSAPRLAWDAIDKSVAARDSDTSIAVSYQVTNRSAESVVIDQISPSCGCMSVSAPPRPWTLAPGASGTVGLRVNLDARIQEPIYTAVVSSTAGTQVLVARIRTAVPAALRDRPNPLRWDAMEKSAEAIEGEPLATFAFRVTNSGNDDVLITHVEPSCGCTTAELPSDPWRLSPGETGTLRLKVDLAGKSGAITKSAIVYSSAGAQTLRIHLAMTPMDPAARERNRQTLARNPEAIFGGDCARCHVEPGKGKTGGALFAADCGICHELPNRSSAVPVLPGPNRDPAFLRQIIADGRPGTSMPAFASARHGPLSDAQVDSLVEYLRETKSPVAAAGP